MMTKKVPQRHISGEDDTDEGNIVPPSNPTRPQVQFS